MGSCSKYGLWLSIRCMGAAWLGVHARAEAYYDGGCLVLAPRLLQHNGKKR